MDMATVIGGRATTLQTVEFLPQIYHNYVHKSAQGLSSGTLAILLVDVLLWLSYGLLKHDGVLWLGSACMIVIVLILVAQKVYYDD